VIAAQQDLDTVILMHKIMYLSFATEARGVEMATSIVEDLLLQWWPPNSEGREILDDVWVR